MDADEKLTALKKAYADIILNISKEAAARVLASEKKAARYQHELKVSKEEAVKMLVRLKQMMDSKINEAESASVNQQQKIEEVEAQLQEAEDIVSDLREELRETQAELERIKTENFQPANKSENFRSNELPIENGNHSYQSSAFLPSASQDELAVPSHVTTPHQSLRNESHRYCNKVVCMCGSYTGNRDLPSIILRGKEPGLYRNGCTQRIIACERNQLCFSKKTEKKDRKSEMGLNDDKGTRKSLDSEAKSTSQIEKKQFFGKKADVFESCIQKKRRTIRRGKYMSPVTENPILSEISVRSDPTPVNENAYLCDNTEFSGKEENLVEVDVKDVLNTAESIENMVPITVETGNVESSLSLDHKKGVENINSSEGICSKHVRERDFRYTFQRKRKIETLSNSPDVREKKTGDDMNGSDQKGESSRDQQRLAQVARQLISLSEKKWWQ